MMTAEREVDADERLDEHAGADHLRDQVEGDDGERAERRGRACRLLPQPEAQDVGDRVLARVPHALGEQEHDRQERDEEADGVQEAVEAVEVDQAGDAEEARCAEVVAGDRQAILEARDRTARGPERVGSGHPLGRPVRDAEGDREDDAEDGERLDVDFGQREHHQRTPGSGSVVGVVVVGAAPLLKRPPRFSTISATLSASGSNVRSALRRYHRPSTATMTNCVSARQ